MTDDTAALLARYSGLIPRYTSYPTAAQFTTETGPEDLAGWLEELPVGAPLSLYFHVPFCDELCRFCACNTAVVRSAEMRNAYADLLIDELNRAARLTGADHEVTHLHWGGGTPTSLPAEAIERVMTEVERLYPISANAEISIELDPRHVPEGCGALLSRLGFNRVSLGVQDIDPAVQEASGRIQSEAQTESCIQGMREAGIRSVNIDLIYGLPRQIEESVTRTAETIAALRPDRLAVFGYAHVPWKQKRQRLIAEDTLPGLPERLAQRQAIDRVLRAAGYLAVGLDHYVLPTDSMAHAVAEGTLRRNFQGYTTDVSDVLVGIGASAISSFPQGLAQNPPAAAGYKEALQRKTSLPTWRGVTRTDDDKRRAAVIERLMCGLGVELDEGFARERAALAPMIADGLVTLTDGRLEVTDKGRAFVRNAAAVFDRYLAKDGTPRHSSAV